MLTLAETFQERSKAMTNPRLDCQIVMEPHAEERRLDRGLPLVDLINMVRSGDWEDRPNGATDIGYGNWTIRVNIGRCVIAVATVFPRR